MSFEQVDAERQELEQKLSSLIKNIGSIPIASPRIMPYGWRKAAKGRTVWRIVEEVISQGLESQASQLGFEFVEPAESEVGVYDFRFKLIGHSTSYVNIKSSVLDGRTNKDDISKADGLINFYHDNPDANLYIATFTISFNKDLTIGLVDCSVFPTAWIPDIYVNPSNNGNVQSSRYKKISQAIKRTPHDFLTLLIDENNKAKNKRSRKSS